VNGTARGSARCRLDGTPVGTNQPTVDVSGTLRYTPAAQANGVATVTVTLRDSGGTECGGVDTSAPQAFTITIRLLYRVYLPLVLRNHP